jgi:transposase
MKAISRRPGGYMSNKDELLEAIEHYDVFTKKQRQVLKVLANIEIDSIATVSAVSLAKMAGVSAGAIYKVVKLFKEEGYLKNIDDTARKIYRFKINKNKLEEVNEIYKSKKNYLINEKK